MSAKIILADESITIQKVVQIIYRRSDTQLATVSSYDELMDTCRSFGPDILLLSASFPGISLDRDIPLISQMKEKPGLPVVVLADRAEGLNPETANSYGASGFLYKPLDNRQLKKTIEQILTAEKSPPEEVETGVQPPVPTETAPVIEPSAPEEGVPAIKISPVGGTPEQRSRILMEIFESYLNENTVLITDSLARNLAPKIAPEVAGKIIESIDFSDLSFKIATIVEGVIRDLVPQLAEELISREIDKIKEEAARLVVPDDSDQVV